MTCLDWSILELFNLFGTPATSHRPNFYYKWEPNHPPTFNATYPILIKWLGIPNLMGINSIHNIKKLLN